MPAPASQTTRPQRAGANETNGSSVFPQPSSQCLRAELAGADADSLLDRCHENLAVADLAGAGGLADGVDHALDQRVLDHHLDLHFGQEAHGVLGAAIDLGLALLPTEALHFADRQALDAKPGERIAHLVELE